MRFLFTNPDNIGVFPSFIFKAYGGTIATYELMGRNFMGEFWLNDAFKTYPNTNYYSVNSGCVTQPSAPLWNTGTNYQLTLGTTLSGANNSYAILEWVLVDPTYGEVSQYTVDSSKAYDWMTISYAPNNRILYIIQKATTTTSYSSMTFGQLRNTHYLQNSNFNVYILTNPSITLNNCPISQSWNNANHGYNAYGQAQISNFDLQDRTVSASGWQYMSIYMGTPQTMQLLTTDPSNMVVIVQFVNNYPYTSFPNNNYCTLETGIMSTDPLNPISCVIVPSTNSIIFSNVNKFTGSYLNFNYYATNPASAFYNIQITLMVYANQVAYNTSSDWYIFYSTTSAYNINPQFVIP